MGSIERCTADRMLCRNDPNLESYYLTLNFDVVEKQYGIKLDRRKSYLIQDNCIWVMRKINGHRWLIGNSKNLDNILPNGQPADFE